MNPVDNALQILTRRIAIIGFSGLVVVAVLTLFDATFRHLGLPRIPGFGDTGEVVYAIVIASCFPAGLLRGQNIRITLLGDRFFPRAQPWFEVFAGLLTLLVFAAIAAQFVLMTWDLQSAQRVTSTVRMPIAPWWWLSTLIMLTTIPVQAWVSWIALRDALRPTQQN